MKTWLKIVIIMALIVSSLLVYLYVDKQQRRLVSYWWQDWQRSIQTPNQTYTLFLGSSSIARLPSAMVHDCSPMVKYGFDNGTTHNVSAYLSFANLQNVDKVVMYIGENDMARGELPTVTATEVIGLVNTIQARARTSIPIALIKIKYSPARQFAHGAFLQFNELMETRYNAEDLGVAPDNSLNNNGDLLNVDSTPLVSLLPFDTLSESYYFVNDGIHLNALGNNKFTQFINDFCRNH